VLQVHERAGGNDRDRGDDDEAPYDDDDRVSTTSATNASRSASEPALT
jgi:hypothetical protein